ncbi:hypothetical protein V1506DRAFT_64450 [Lipomyces tetrasporus]
MPEQTAAAKPRRSRSGCLGCKGRKRRCGEEKPACRECVRRGQICSFLVDKSPQIPVKFRICRGPRGFLLPLERKKWWHFLNCSLRDVHLLSADYQDAEDPGDAVYNLKNHRGLSSNTSVSNVDRDFLVLGSLGSLGTFSQFTATETQLFQYYVEVICRIRVFQDDENNKFRHLIVPLCRHHGPLLHAVIALSANDRMPTSISNLLDYTKLALNHKSLA